MMASLTHHTECGVMEDHIGWFTLKWKRFVSTGFKINHSKLCVFKEYFRELHHQVHLLGNSLVTLVYLFDLPEC